MEERASKSWESALQESAWVIVAIGKLVVFQMFFR